MMANWVNRTSPAIRRNGSADSSSALREPDFKPTSIFGRDMLEFTEYFNRGGRTSIGHHARVFYCVEPLTYIGQEEVKADITNLKSALQGKQLEEGFYRQWLPAQWSTG
jgi:hypothetical protein